MTRFLLLQLQKLVRVSRENKGRSRLCRRLALSKAPKGQRRLAAHRWRNKSNKVVFPLSSFPFQKNIWEHQTGPVFEHGSNSGNNIHDLPKWVMNRTYCPAVPPSILASKAFQQLIENRLDLSLQPENVSYRCGSKVGAEGRNRQKIRCPRSGILVSLTHNLDQFWGAGHPITHRPIFWECLYLAPLPLRIRRRGGAEGRN
jgi:hypothetical protein